MRTIKVDILDEKAMSLLKTLESLSIIRIVKIEKDDEITTVNDDTGYGRQMSQQFPEKQNNK